ncbi:MAG TPA: diadenylate cyclase CdaA [Candidatus Sulfotelmatobacter sp.]|nr:diadenylate cyclase CdaA [Candidatus Sulfotelmatobacter sp.]
MSDVLRTVHVLIGVLSWRDIVDVLIVALLLYQLLKLIQGTQAVQLLLGLVVLYLIGFAAQQLHLRLLEFIFANGGQAILIAAIVLFQPELRRALDQVGRLGTVRSMVGRHGGVEGPGVVDEVIRAARSLSERRLGALIVFERETGLDNLAATGVRINGEVTAEMLATLFVHGSPLHDGAVIIHQHRLVAAGCVLPLAETVPGYERMGTRHRAAIGLTLQSDAVILIVSEESGLISVAHQGRFAFRGYDQAQLRDKLQSLVGPSVAGRRPMVLRPLARTSAALGRRAHP